MKLITTEEAAAMMRLGPSTLRKWRMEGRHLPIYKMGRKAVRYDEADVLRFIESNRTAALRGRVEEA